MTNNKKVEEERLFQPPSGWDEDKEMMMTIQVDYHMCKPCVYV